MAMMGANQSQRHRGARPFYNHVKRVRLSAAVGLLLLAICLASLRDVLRFRRAMVTDLFIVLVYIHGPEGTQRIIRRAQCVSAT